MFDITSGISYKSVNRWYSDIRRECPLIPIVLCGNKVDCKDRRVNVSDIDFHRNNNINYYDISAKSNFNFEKPFLDIARSLISSNITFIESPAVLPPECVVSDSQLAEWSRME